MAIFNSYVSLPEGIPLVLMANRALSETGPSASGGFTICFQMFPDQSFFEDKGKAGTYQMIYILCIEYNVLLLYSCQRNQCQLCCVLTPCSFQSHLMVLLKRCCSPVATRTSVTRNGPSNYDTGWSIRIPQHIGITITPYHCQPTKARSGITMDPLVNKHSYWKWSFIVDLPMKNGDFP